MRVSAIRKGRNRHRALHRPGQRDAVSSKGLSPPLRSSHQCVAAHVGAPREIGGQPNCAGSFNHSGAARPSVSTKIRSTRRRETSGNLAARNRGHGGGIHGTSGTGIRFPKLGKAEHFSAPAGTIRAAVSRRSPRRRSSGVERASLPRRRRPAFALGCPFRASQHRLHDSAPPRGNAEQEEAAGEYTLFSCATRYVLEDRCDEGLDAGASRAASDAEADLQCLMSATQRPRDHGGGWMNAAHPGGQPGELAG